MRRMLPLALTAFTALTLLAGCATAPTPQSSRPVENTVDQVESDIDWGAGLDLVNLWRVTDADGAGDRAFLRLDGDGLMVWTDCGVATGSWRARGTAFLADIWGADGGSTCFSGSGREPAESLRWLYDAHGFRLGSEGGSLELFDAQGVVVATLSVGGVPPSSPNYLDDYLVAPEITPAIEALFVATPPMPADITSADATSILDRWVFVGNFSSGPPFAKFASDGSWTASDGCNGGAGRWTIGDGGLFLATSGASTLIGCEGVAVPYWVSNTARVGFRDSRLVLLDAAGLELGELEAS